MKKKTILSVAALIIAAIVSVTLLSCKKDKEKEEADLKTMNADAQVLLDKIEAFQTLRKTVNSGAKTNGTMTVNEMRDVIDLTSNYEYSQHEIYCLNTTLDTIHVSMPIVDDNGNVSDGSVVSVYNAFEAELENLMLTIDDGMDVPSYFSIILPEDTSDQDIDIVFVRGEQDDKHTSVGPFVEGDNYKWGLKLGHCSFDPTARITDAAMELTRKFKFQPDAQHQGLSCLMYNPKIVYYKPCTDSIPGINAIYYSDPNMEDCADTWLYMLGGEYDEAPCIDYDEMNCYWRSVRRNIVLPYAPLYYGPDHVPYHQCDIFSVLLYGPSPYLPEAPLRTLRVHYARVIYCNIVWIQE